MFSAFSKFCFGLAALAAIAGVAYGIAAGADQGGSALFFAASVAAAIAGVVSYATADADRAPFVAANAPAPERRQVSTSGVARGSTWPFGAGLAATLLAVGVATGAPLVIVGVIVAVVVAFGWLAQVWREHPNWRPEFGERMNDRFVVPIGLPGTILLFAGIGVFSFSRLLLAVSEAAAPLIAFGASVLVLAGCAVVAVKPVGRGAIRGLATVAAALVIASGVGGAVAGEREFHKIGEEAHGGEHAEEGGDHAEEDATDAHGDEPSDGKNAPGTPQDEADAGSDNKNAQSENPSEEGEAGSGGQETLTLTAQNSQQFEQTRLEAPANTTINVLFTNGEQGVSHNVSFYDGDEAIHEGEIIVGPRRVTETFKTPDAGTYEFRCDVHPQTMKGEFVVA